MIKKVQLPLQKILLLLLLIADVSFFSFPIISDFFASRAAYHTKILCAFIVVAMLVVQCVTNHGKFVISKRGDNRIIQAYFIVIIVVFLISMFSYGDTTVSFLREFYYYFIPPVLIAILLFNMEKDAGYCDFLIEAIIIVGIIYAVYSIFAYVAYEGSGLTIMNTSIQLYSERNGHVRIPRITDFIGLSTVLSLIRLLSKYYKRNLIYLLGTITGIISIFVVGQTRIYQVAIVVVAVILLFKRQKSMVNKIVLFVLLCLLVYLVSDSIIDFFQSFTEYSASTENRLLAYIYYMGHFFDHIFFGMGFVSSQTHYSLLHGSLGIYWITDCGYIGFLAIFGLLGAILLIFVLAYMFRNLVRVIREKTCTGTGMLLMGMITYFLITNWSVAITDVQRCVIGSFILAIIIWNVRHLNTVDVTVD